ncbi:hypothetical protein ACLB2K_011840 [Fragaria x ananassa]
MEYDASVGSINCSPLSNDALVRYLEKEWDAFVAQRSSEAWRKMSDKMKAIRGRQLFPHTLSRKGYARNEHDHKKKLENPCVEQGHFSKAMRSPKTSMSLPNVLRWKLNLLSNLLMKGLFL